MDKEYVSWGWEALGNNLCKSSSLKAGGEEFPAVSLSGWRRPARCGPKSPKGQKRAPGWALGGGTRGSGGTRARRGEERRASRELPLLTQHCRRESRSRGTTVPSGPRLPWGGGGSRGGTGGRGARGHVCRSAGSRCWRGRPCCLLLPSSGPASRPLPGSRCLLNVKALFLLPL